jgi:hypothetical protein
MNDIHTCSYYCSRPECIKAQRDQMRSWIYNTLGDEKFQEMMVYKAEPQLFCYQCDKECKWLASDSRCSTCTRTTPEDEV